MSSQRALESLITSIINKECVELETLRERISVTDAVEIYRSLQTIREWRGWTALHCATSRGDTDTVRCLLQRLRPEQIYELLKIQDNHGLYTTLHWVAARGDAETIECMLGPLTSEQRYNLLTIQDGEGWTALHWATDSEDVESVWYLLDPLTPEQCHSLLRICANEGDTVLHYAAYFGHTNLIRYFLNLLPLQQQFEILHLQNASGKTALGNALQESHPETAEYIRGVMSSDGAGPSIAGEGRQATDAQRAEDVDLATVLEEVAGLTLENVALKFELGKLVDKHETLETEIERMKSASITNSQALEGRVKQLEEGHGELKEEQGRIQTRCHTLEINTNNLSKDHKDTCTYLSRMTDWFGQLRRFQDNLANMVNVVMERVTGTATAVQVEDSSIPLPEGE